MNWFDIVTAILLLIALINGYRKGLIMQLVVLATIVMAALFGGRLAEMILPTITNLINLTQDAARVLSFILAFLLIALLLSLVGRIVQRFIDVIMLSFINRLLGALIAAGTMMLVLSILLNLVLILDINEGVIKRETREESFFFKRVEAVVPALIPYLNQEFWNEYIPDSYREEIEKKSDSIYQHIPEHHSVDSSYQKRYFNIDA